MGVPKRSLCQKATKCGDPISADPICPFPKRQRAQPHEAAHAYKDTAHVLHWCVRVALVVDLQHLLVITIIITIIIIVILLLLLLLLIIIIIIIIIITIIYIMKIIPITSGTRLPAHAPLRCGGSVSPSFVQSAHLSLRPYSDTLHLHST